MCIVFFEWSREKQGEGTRFTVAHNRDEMLSRETKSVHLWEEEASEIFAPRDLVGGGSWFAYEKRTNRVAFLTNIRRWDTTSYSSSRGDLVIQFVKSRKSAIEFMQDLHQDQETEYAGFNLVGFSGTDLAYYSNKSSTGSGSGGSGAPISLKCGFAYGLSNSLLFEPWKKVELGLKRFNEIKHLDDEELIQQLQSQVMHHEEQLIHRVEELPQTNYSDDFEFKCSSIFVPLFSFFGGDYGTRTTIILILHSDRKTLFEADLNPTTREWIKTKISL